MQDKDKPAFLAFMARFGELYDKKLTPIVLEEYWTSLCHYEITDLMMVKESLKERCRRFPTISEFSEAMRQTKEQYHYNHNRPKLLDQPWTESDSKRSSLWALLSRWLWYIPKNRDKYIEEFKSMTFDEQQEWLLTWITEMSSDEKLVDSMRHEVLGTTK